ncbi:MAG: ATP-binding protein [Patescibacteria group bacterium]
MHETRVNLKHLLEDIRDSYALTLEEVIIVELIANSLDSDASKIDFSVNPFTQTFTVLDNGQGMRRQALKEYHNIAASTKLRGTGIGFAGIGAKLSLLVADSVITETKAGRSTHAATTWHLSSDTRAPWQFIPCPGTVTASRGTAVTITLADPNSALLRAKFIQQTIISHFYPLLVPQFFEQIYRYLYKNGIEFTINGAKLELSHPLLPETSKIFRIVMGSQTKRLTGFGYLAQANFDETENQGLSISTYGKVIKSGWEWIGLETPTNQRLFGFVEIPALSQILTINKMDFLRDATSLKKYYRFRKAIQSAVLPILSEFGNEQVTIDPVKALRPLTRQIEQTLRRLLSDFPELLPLLGVRTTKNATDALKSLSREPLVKILEKEVKLSGHQENVEEIDPLPQKKRRGESKKRAKSSTLAIGYESAKPSDSIARMIESNILINTAHPAYLKAQKLRVEGYHAIFCVAWSLSHFLEDSRSPQAFMNDFLSSWGRQEPKTAQLFE